MITYVICSETIKLHIYFLVKKFVKWLRMDKDWHWNIFIYICASNSKILKGFVQLLRLNEWYYILESDYSLLLK